ncbi:MAG: GNAT family N-acetyltransferase [Patescibacteria group bacterium]|nr:GNAT family N-acetyltransferase [Patescibacteria group bacterium]
MERIIIESLKVVSNGVTKALNSLLLQLVSNAKPLTDEAVREMLSSSSNRLLIAKDQKTNTIVGMLTLVIYRIPSVKKGVIHELVVDERWRQKGIGRKLIACTIEQARKEGIQYLDLTSNPKRESANKLYQSIGFEKRDTNVYRMKL